MNTAEHTELGNALRYNQVGDNPYLRLDENGTLYLRLQRFVTKNVPEVIELELSAGEIVGMAGDYFTQANWWGALDLPPNRGFDIKEEPSSSHSTERLGNYLIKQKVTEDEAEAFIKAYNNLAAPTVNRKIIDTIYNINNSTYIPYFTSLNFYIQQIMLYLRVKNYGKMLDRNQTHFTPWSVKVYTLGHHIALKYARLSYELKQLMDDASYESDNEDLLALLRNIKKEKKALSYENLQDLVYRYHALALCMELFTFHYYTDHFASGHMSMVGDLRALLPQRFGDTLGGALANNIHNELNLVSVYTKKPYTSTPDNAPPVIAQGDFTFDSDLNSFNKSSCLKGMHDSLQDINNVLLGGEIPAQKEYGGVRHMPDIDFNYRLYQPLLVLGDDNRIYYRTRIRKIFTLSPSDFVDLCTDPKAHGYTQLKNKWDAFRLVTKLRVFPFIYTGKIQPLSAEELIRIEADENECNSGRKTISVPLGAREVVVALPRWRKTISSATIMTCLNQHGFLFSSTSSDVDGLTLSDSEEAESTLNITP